MAEFHVKAIDHAHVDEAKDVRGAYKRGDVVQVYHDGTFTEHVLNPKFVLIKVAGLSFDDAQKHFDFTAIARIEGATDD